jgi:gag-polyprotein putative aspartyl protease
VPDLVASGPIVQVSIGPSRELILSLGSLATTLEPPHPVTAVIDTGAQTTVLNPDTVKRLRLKPVGRTFIVTPSTTHPVECHRYHVNVYFSEACAIENIFAVEAPMGGQPYQCLIGRDVLRLGEFHYRGVANEYSLIF